MRIEFVQRNYDMAKRLEEVVTKKLDKLSRYFDDEAACKVTLKKQRDLYKMEVAISFGGSFIRAEISSDNMYDNIDLILPKIEKQIFKYKSKLQKQLRESAFKDIADGTAYGTDETSNLVRIKQIDLRPMQVEDALMELDLVDHDFYVFINEKSKDVNIVYRRDDGDIGLLEGR